MKKYLILIIAIIMLMANAASAHKVTGYEPKRTQEGINVIENFFKEKYGLELKNEIWVHVVNNYKDFEVILKVNNVPDYEGLTRATYAVTSGNNILINACGLSDETFLFVLAHEFTHKYQAENMKDVHTDYVQMEGQADIVAGKISKKEIIIKDHKVPYEALKSREQFFKQCELDPKKTLEQIRYYASKTDFLESLKMD